MLLIILSFTLSLISINSPILLNVFLIILASLTGLLVNYYTISWFAFIIFLLYVGGILVLFIYFSSLTPNHQFYFKGYLIILTLSILTLYRTNPVFSNKLNTLYNFREALTLFSLNFYTFSLLIIVFLFTLLIIVVKITSNLKTPIRPFL